MEEVEVIETEPTIETTTAWVNEGTDKDPDWKFYKYTSENGSEAEPISIEVHRHEQPADCTTDGRITWEALYEGAGTKEQIIPALGHKWLEPAVIDTKEATCTEEGYNVMQVVCGTCGEAQESYTVKTADPKGHKAGKKVKENEVAPTCTEAGSYDEVVYCTVCNAELSRETKVVDKLGHKFSDYYEAQDATCTKPGYVYAECTVCGEKVKEEIPAKGHKAGEPVKEKEVKATYTEAGSYEEVVYCKVCKEELSREAKTSEPLGHDYKVEGTLKEATCTESGEGTWVCTRCKDAKEDVIPAKGHTRGDYVEKEGTRVEPTCEKDGSRVLVSTCTVCGEEADRKTEVLKKTEHKKAEPVEENRVDATCTEAGSYDEVVYCTNKNCDKKNNELSRVSKTIPVLNHTPAEAVTDEDSVVDATCKTEGSYDEVVYCEVCGTELSRVSKTTPINPNEDGHKWEVKKEVEAATCEKNGLGYYECSLCGIKKAEEAQVIPALGHALAKPVAETVKAATCTETGIDDMVVYCTNDNCDLKNKEYSRESVETPALGHSFDRDGVVLEDAKYVSKEPTCTKTGLGLYHCEVCNKDVADVVIPATGHKEGKPTKENYVGNGNCKEIGNYDEVVRCTVCKSELSRDKKTVEAVEEHAYSADKVKFHFNENGKSGVAVFQCTNKAVDPNGETQCNDKHYVMIKVDEENPISYSKPTCEEPGYAKYVATATYKGVTATMETPRIPVEDPNGHNRKVKIVESEKEGFYDVVTYCTVCEEIFETKTEAISGIDAEMKITKEPTCELDGSYEVTIKDDNSGVTKTVTKPIPALGHKEAPAVKENEKAATCTEKGSYEEVVYCSVGGE